MEGGGGRFVRYRFGSYSPTWVEWSITAGWFAGFALLYLLFTKFLPVLTIWELKEGLDESGHHAPAQRDIR